MTRYTRIVFGFNAIYQTVVGALCLLAPAAAIGVYGGSESEQSSTMLLMAFRLIGVNLIPIGVISALVAGNPDSYPVLRPLMGLVSALTLVCWGIVFGSHELHPGQIMTIVLDVLVQVALLVGIVFYSPKVKPQPIFVRRRAAA